ncbi:acyl-CoA dehydrogenase, C-terminal domain protein [Mycolicibacterium hassiacum DSM 44199]|jgi:alkylation response protein AidB-like acyl-CoA dehydrogenase|uniref:Acyl-CoA dehydrogenase, C-terminal domain protein n=1 Tax=Mycolicibacterium hassiacum (strain DSM 44199 / CIP 105218 / JCM 12690 / 3849) TaxID=1122247 RepID=K5B7B3_MYCHD|nr:acyl-CoA dehydrogenase family protein [Mycolicibacterium hassiacum]EKF21648.1 acyl-CoA dehydrogenase, C-terminal domain protein [Mycolicibacterium hassiacum DSM 44199]MBX5486463.1 acyl-CoA dehydrogenase family protein [Mycolicibacterium hassiacum]MDA4084262.1 acyl-CoA dehydrogenase [Mycolicibacterium hassiacum DSM 44199]VCT91271.1 Acyl-CoA dehydrogenase [Mycolicibacterium hassiacum DSM 44199]
MTFPLTDEQQELAATVADFLEKRSPENEVRRLMEAGGAPDPTVWAQLTGQLGLAGLVVPEEYGGGGFGYLDFALVAERAGAALLVAPLLSTVAAASALMLSADDELKAGCLPALAAGEKVGTLALAEASGSLEAAAVQTAVESGPAGVRLAGEKMYVVDGTVADLFIVSARTPAGTVGLYAVDADADGVSVEALQTLDMTRPQARVVFTDAPARPLADDFDAAGLVDRALATAAILLAAEQVGGAQRCLDMAVEYAKVRVQFGKPIGSFQAIKHKCADMLLAVESARSAAYYAAGTLDAGDPDEVRIAAALAKAHCSTSYTRVAAENIQIHGGIGFTWEHPAQLYFKRAKTSEILFGDPVWQRERLATLVGI